MSSTDFYMRIKESPASIAIVDEDFRILSCSDSLLEDIETDLQEVEGTLFYHVFPAFPEKLRSLRKDSFKGTSLIEEVARYQNNGSRSYWYRWKIYHWTEEDKLLDRYTVVRDDVTELKRSEDLLAKSLSVARIGGWEVDLVNNEIFWTEITREIHEVDADYVPYLEEGINFYKAGADREKITALVSDGIREGKPWDTELRIITAKGRELWVRAKGEAEMADGKCLRLYGTFQDIDEKKRMEIKLRQISERLALATSAAKVGVWEYNVADNHLMWDDNMYSLYGVCKEDFAGVYEAWESAVHPEDKEESTKQVQLAISGEREFDTEFRVVWPNGETRYIRAFANTQRNSSGEAIRMIGTNWDITEIRQAEGKLKNLLEVSSEQNKSLMNFAHIVSHNLRSHSSNLSMLTGFLSKEKNKSERLRLIQMLDEASESLNETVQHLNDVVQVNTDSGAKMKPVNLSRQLKSVQKNLRLMLEERNTECNSDIAKDLFVKAIPAYLDSILLNLFTNSIKYSDPEKDLKLKISASVEGPEVCFRFSDNGLGIDLERHGDKIFGMYKTFHRHKDAKGIGLFITRNQVEAMNGTIAVESKVGQGTTFIIRLEVARPNNSA